MEMMQKIQNSFYSLPNDTFVTLTELKVFADSKFNFAKMMISVCDRLENVARKGGIADYKYFLLFQQCFQKLTSSKSLKLGIME